MIQWNEMYEGGTKENPAMNTPIFNILRGWILSGQPSVTHAHTETLLSLDDDRDATICDNTDGPEAMRLTRYGRPRKTDAV